MALAAGAAFIIGKTFWGTPITGEVTDTAIAVILETISLVLSLRAHTAPIEKVQSGVRNFFALAGGFFVSRGLISTETSVMIVGAAVSLSAYLYSKLSKAKTTKLQTGQLNVNQLKGT